MSKAARTSIFILIVLLISTLALAAYFWIVEQPNLVESKKELTGLLEKSQEREVTLTQDLNKAKKDIKKIEREKVSLQEKINKGENRIKSIKANIATLTSTRDELKDKISAIDKEHNRELNRVTKNLREERKDLRRYKDKERDLLSKIKDLENPNLVNQKITRYKDQVQGLNKRIKELKTKVLRLTALKTPPKQTTKTPPPKSITSQKSPPPLLQ